MYYNVEEWYCAALCSTSEQSEGKAPIISPEVIQVSDMVFKSRRKFKVKITNH